MLPSYDGNKEENMYNFGRSLETSVAFMGVDEISDSVLLSRCCCLSVLPNSLHQRAKCIYVNVMAVRYHSGYGIRWGPAVDSTQVRVLLPPPSHPDRKSSPLLSFQRPHHAALNPTLFAGGRCDWLIRSCRPWKVAVAAVWWGLVGCFLLGPSNLTDWELLFA